MPSSTSLKLLTCNIEGSRHLERVLPFLKAQQADVICLQEAFEIDLPVLAAELGASWDFVPLLNADRPNSFTHVGKGKWGLAILTTLPVIHKNYRYFVGSKDQIPLVDEQNSNCLNRAVLWVDVEKEGEVYRLATTHFTWSPNGSYIPLQGENLVSLTEILQGEVHEFVLCGDFNSPRGGEIYQRLTTWLTDNIPVSATTTLDKKWHRAGDLQFVVDYVFTTNKYTAADVQLHDNVSDHMAVTALISKLA